MWGRLLHQTGLKLTLLSWESGHANSEPTGTRITCSCLSVGVRKWGNKVRLSGRTLEVMGVVWVWSLLYAG